MSKISSKTFLNIVIFILASALLCLMLGSSSDQLPPWLSKIVYSDFFKRMGINQIIFNLSVAGLTSIVMFFLLVRVPEWERQKRIKRHLKTSYKTFKQRAIEIFVSSVGHSSDKKTIDLLMDPSEFRKFFKEKYKPDQDRWHGVANNIDNDILVRLIIEAELLFNEFQYAKNVIDISQPEAHTFLTNISQILYCAKYWNADDYDGTKGVLRFFWQVLAAWDFENGYRSNDEISMMISKL